MNKNLVPNDFIRQLAEAVTRASAGSIAIDVLKNDKQDAKEWFAFFDRCAVGNGWSELTKGAKLYLKGDAEYIWKQMKKADQYNYRKIKKKIIKKFESEDKTLEITSKFFNSTQGEDESVEEYSRELKWQRGPIR